MSGLVNDVELVILVVANAEFYPLNFDYFTEYPLWKLPQVCLIEDLPIPTDVCPRNREKMEGTLLPGIEITLWAQHC